MSPKLKQISEQVVVITGGSNGVGLSIALLAAARGARVVLSSRIENDLRDAVSRIRQNGGEAIYVVADVSNVDDVDSIAQRALQEYGRIDSWINNECLTIFGKLTSIPLEEKRRVFDINFWGVVHGCRAAVKSMKKSGGAIVNIANALSLLSLPDGITSISQHAVKSYTDILRAELDGESVPISISLIRGSKFASEPIDEKLMAKAILDCCVNAKKEIFFGTSKIFSTAENFVPKFTDFLMERIVDKDGVAKSAVVAAGLGVAAFAAYKVVQNVRKPGEVTH